MPVYTYTCESCKQTYDKLTSLQDRDDQICDIQRRQADVEVESACGGKLLREEISVTAKMPYNWSRW